MQLTQLPTQSAGCLAQALTDRRDRTVRPVCLCVFACLVEGGVCVPARLPAHTGQCQSPQCSCDEDLGETAAGRVCHLT